MKAAEYSLYPSHSHNGNIGKGDKKRQQHPLEKSFRKKEHIYDHESQKKGVKKRLMSVSKQKQKHNNRSQAVQVSPIRMRDISPKIANSQKKIQKISLRDNAYKEPSKITMFQKLLTVSSIFQMEINLSPDQMLQSLYQKNDNYQALLECWQKCEMYDECDKILYQLIQKYLRIIEQFALQTLLKLQISLANYENVVTQLVSENNQLKQQNKQQKGSEAMVQNLNETVSQLFQRSKFSSYVICSISNYGLDVENFVGKILMHHIQNQYSLPKEGISLHLNNYDKEINLSYCSQQGKQTSIVNIQKLSIKSEMMGHAHHRSIEADYPQLSLN